MDDLVAFLTARLDEDEAAARAATDGPWHPDGMSVRGKGRDRHGGRGDAVLVIRHTWPQEAAHICRHDPARVLREVGARRVVVRRCRARMNEPDAYPNGLVSPRALLARQVLMDLAAAYSDHPGYRAEWNP